MRKSEIVTVPSWAGSRDAGKNFRITEMPAAQAEKWAMRALLALNQSKASIPMEMRGIGMEGLFLLGINVFLQGDIKPEVLEPLMDEMFGCVKMVRDMRSTDKLTGEPVATEVGADDIEEVRTRLWLRSEVLRVHVNFSPADALFSLIQAIRDQTATSPTP